MTPPPSCPPAKRTQDRGKALILHYLIPALLYLLYGFRQATYRFPISKNERKNPKDKSAKVRGQGSGALERHGGVPTILSTWKTPNKLNAISEPPLANSHPSTHQASSTRQQGPEGQKPCSLVFRLGKGQLHSYLSKHLAPFPHVKPESAQAWDSCQAMEAYLA